MDSTPTDPQDHSSSPTHSEPLSTLVSSSTAAPPPPVVHVSTAAPKSSFKVILGVGFAMLSVFMVGFYLGFFAAKSDPSPIIEQVYRQGDDRQSIVIVPVRGMITDGMVPFIRQSVDRIIKDPTVGAVIIRVDSGGGTVAASDRIHHLLQKIAKDKKIPIVASYGGLAASGGYYVSCFSDHIVAEPSTLTGSIGVIAQVLTFEKLLKEKLGIEPVVLTASGSPSKRIGNQVFESWGEEDRAKWQKMLDTMHTRFMKIVQEGRGAKLAAVKSSISSVANGSVFMADEAVANGVVDSVGYLDDAIDKAVELGSFGGSEPTIVVYAPRRSLFEQMLGGMATQGAPGQSRGSIDLRAIDPDLARQWINELSSPKMMYLFHH
jgi:protease-4